MALQRIFRAVPVPVVIASPVTAKILWVNDHLSEMYGADADEVIGMSLLDFIDASQLGRALADMGRVVLGQSPPPVTYQLKKANGEYAAGQVSSIPFIFRGHPAMLSFVTDVSERERQVMSLRDSEERYRLLLDTMPSGVVVVADDYIVYANNALARALGFSTAEELLEKRMDRFIDEDYRASMNSARRTMLASGKNQPAVPIVLLRRDRSQLSTTASSTVIRWDGRLASQTLLCDVGISAADRA